MVPENFRFGGGATETVLHPLVAVWMLIAIVLILSLRRDRIMIPFLLAFFSTPSQEVLVLAGVHFTMHQILIFTVLARMTVYRGSSSDRRFQGGFNALDRVVVLWAFSSLLIFNIEFMDKQAFIKSMGDFVLAMGGYLAVRFLVPDGDAVRRMIKVMAVICLIQGVCMLTELSTYQNLFFPLGGAWPTYREGHVRAEGAMGTLYGGALAGALIPLFVWLWMERKSRTTAVAGLVGATAMVFASHASTSAMAYGAGLLGLGFWPLRKYMRMVRLSIVAMLVGLHLVMNGPVWSLIEKIDITGGSSSYHRYQLVDNCIRHFSDWWLVGYKYYYAWGFCMFDLCNQFVGTAVAGGLVSLVLYIMIFSRSFGAIGKARKQVEGDRHQEWLLWCLGSFLFSVMVAAFGINYMFHLLMCFLLLVASISVTAFEAIRSPARQAEKVFEPPLPVGTELSWDSLGSHQ